jgi:hypothetical protein
LKSIALHQGSAMRAANHPSHLFNTHVKAGAAILEPGNDGLDMRQLSRVDKGYHNGEQLVGFPTIGERIKLWGGTGEFRAGAGGLMMPAVDTLPGLGMVAIAGPVVMTLIGALASAPSARH